MAPDVNVISMMNILVGFNFKFVMQNYNRFVFSKTDVKIYIYLVFDNGFGC